MERFTLDNPVFIWWFFLSFVSVLNILFWSWTRYYAYRGKLSERQFQFKNLLNPDNMIWFSGVYVFVCAFRSFLPRADVQRIVLFDSWWSNVFVGRSLATLAELSFVSQWSIVFLFFYKELQIRFLRWLAYTILVLIFIAECFSWYAVIRTHYIGNVVEESLWGVTYILIGAGLFSISTRIKGALRGANYFAIVGSLLYVGFMFLVDVPMYWRRLVSDVIANKPLLDFWSGLVDLNSRWIVTWEIEDWREEISWMSLYFSVAVWVSLAMCYLPFKKTRLLKYLKNM